jgi:hypothetical protein
LAAIGRYEELTLTLGAVDRRAAELARSIGKASDTFLIQLRATERAVFPFQSLSRAFRSVRRFFGGKYFSEADLKEISPLLQIAAGLAELIDVRIMDEKGNPHNADENTNKDPRRGEIGRDQQDHANGRCAVILQFLDGSLP